MILTFLSYTSGWSGSTPVNQAFSFQASEDLLECYAAGDLRRTAFFKSSLHAAIPDKYKTWVDYSDTDEVGMDFLIRLPEVILNKAEALAMLTRDGDAKTELEKLFQTIRSSSIGNGNGEALIDFIRDERRRELCFEGHRWFDLRRYAVNSIHPLPDNFTIRHRNNAYEANSRTWYENGYYELNAYTQDRAAWIIPIPNYAIEFNRGELQNEIRPNRELQRD